MKHLFSKIVLLILSLTVIVSLSITNTYAYGVDFMPYEDNYLKFGYQSENHMAYEVTFICFAAFTTSEYPLARPSSSDPTGTDYIFSFDPADNDFSNVLLGMTVDIRDFEYYDGYFIWNGRTHTMMTENEFDGWYLGYFSGAGYWNGYNDGYDEGLLDGTNDGYDEGYADGSILADVDIYNAGYADGIANLNVTGFYDKLEHWLVPAIISVMFIGGLFTIISIKRNREQ